MSDPTSFASSQLNDSESWRKRILDAGFRMVNLPLKGGGETLRKTGENPLRGLAIPL